MNTRSIYFARSKPSTWCFIHSSGLCAYAFATAGRKDAHEQVGRPLGMVGSKGRAGNAGHEERVGEDLKMENLKDRVF